jgi:hypothetical protein
LPKKRAELRKVELLAEKDANHRGSDLSAIGKAAAANAARTSH